MERLVEHLTREQGLLEQLLCRLVEAYHLLLADEHRFLVQAADDVLAAAAAVREAELVRATTVESLVPADHPTPPTLEAVARRAGEPYRSILLAQRAALADLLAEVEAASSLARELLEGDPRAVPVGAEP